MSIPLTSQLCEDRARLRAMSSDEILRVINKRLGEVSDALHSIGPDSVEYWRAEAFLQSAMRIRLEAKIKEGRA